MTEAEIVSMIMTALFYREVVKNVDEVVYFITLDELAEAAKSFSLLIEEVEDDSDKIKVTINKLAPQSTSSEE